MANANLLNIQGIKDYEKLNAFFADHSYYQNYALSALDIKIYNQLTNTVDKERHPHLYRWYKHISSLPTYVFDQYNKGNEKLNKNKTANNVQGNKGNEKRNDDDDDVDNDIDLFGETNEADKQVLLENKKKNEELKKKQQKEKDKNRSILIIEIKPKSIDTDISKISKLVKQKIVDENIKWGEEIKKIPVAFGLYKLQMSCIIYDDFVNTNDLIEKIENIDLDNEEDRKKRALILGLDDDNEDDERTEEVEDIEVEDDLDFLVQSAEITSFNKL